MLHFTHNESCFFCARNYIQRISNVWKVLETYHMNRLARICFLYRLVVIIRHEFNLAFMQSAHKNIFYPKSSFLNDKSSCNLTRFFINV